MVASYENLYTKYPENILKKVKILGNSRLLTTYGCRECMWLGRCPSVYPTLQVYKCYFLPKPTKAYSAVIPSDIALHTHRQ